MYLEGIENIFTGNTFFDFNRTYIRITILFLLITSTLQNMRASWTGIFCHKKKTAPTRVESVPAKCMWLACINLNFEF